MLMGVSSRACILKRYGDVLAAFKVFATRFNTEERPLLIASHSQGTMHAKRLLQHIATQAAKQRADSGDTGAGVGTADGLADGDVNWSLVQRKMVAAYIIGNTVSPKEFTHGWPQLCTAANSTGCYVTWNTLKNGADPSHWLAKLPGWTDGMSSEYSSSSSNSSSNARERKEEMAEGSKEGKEADELESSGSGEDDDDAIDADAGAGAGAGASVDASYNRDTAVYQLDDVRAACTNPLSWSSSTTVAAGAEDHKGGMGVLGPLFLTGFHTNFVSARCGRDGMLYVQEDTDCKQFCSEYTPQDAALGKWPYLEDMTFKAGGEYHAFDYQLFYHDIRLNAIERVGAYLMEHAGRVEGEEFMVMHEEPTICTGDYLGRWSEYKCTLRPGCTLALVIAMLSVGLLLWVVVVFVFFPLCAPLCCLAGMCDDRFCGSCCYSSCYWFCACNFYKYAKFNSEKCPSLPVMICSGIGCGCCSKPAGARARRPSSESSHTGRNCCCGSAEDGDAADSDSFELVASRNQDDGFELFGSPQSSSSPYRPGRSPPQPDRIKSFEIANESAL